MQIYILLGIQPTATEAEIKRAYRKLALKYHPDKNFGNQKAQEKFVAINKAYQLALKNVNVVKYKGAKNSTKTYTQSSQQTSNQSRRSSSYTKSSTHYSYKHTYYDFHKKKEKKKEQEFDWDKYHSKYSNSQTNQKVKTERARKQTQAQKESYQKIVVEDQSTDFSQAVLYVIAMLVGLLVFITTDNTMWAITTGLVFSSGILLSSLFSQGNAKA